MGGAVVDQGLAVVACVARATLADVAAACLAEAKCTIIAGEAAAGGGHILAQVTGITRRAGAKSSIGEVEAGSLVVAGAGGAVVDGEVTPVTKAPTGTIARDGFRVTEDAGAVIAGVSGWVVAGEEDHLALLAKHSLRTGTDESSVGVDTGALVDTGARGAGIDSLVTEGASPPGQARTEGRTIDNDALPVNTWAGCAHVWNLSGVGEGKKRQGQNNQC